MKTDNIFYRLFQEFPSIFFELIGEQPESANAYKFSSVEIKQTSFRIGFSRLFGVNCICRYFLLTFVVLWTFI
ncbi:DUF2887 domain-containing protein, partial [Iningainema tapete]|nr:DUF2887 domain-containing protein [Iningainema tapete BLCC-T55]